MGLSVWVKLPRLEKRDFQRIVSNKFFLSHFVKVFVVLFLFAEEHDRWITKTTVHSQNQEVDHIHTWHEKKLKYSVALLP